MQMFLKFISSDASAGRKEPMAAFQLILDMSYVYLASCNHPSRKEPMKKSWFVSFTFPDLFSPFFSSFLFARPAHSLGALRYGAKKRLYRSFF